eukprot:TRINITY_DN494_c0_g1_i1.p1 TRINITY_DN494_c0_g1~~TRINITY_DN494_c0_g1_i1.p1  ORF type:complete len:611 (+),score=29.86 TRINITY_DN494_c0_g1_i1:2389-4221(+)
MGANLPRNIAMAISTRTDPAETWLPRPVAPAEATGHENNSRDAVDPRLDAMYLKKQHERDNDDYHNILTRRNRRGQPVAPPPFPIAGGGVLEQWLRPRLSSVRRRKDIPDAANQMRVWRYDGNVSRTYSWSVQDHTQFLQALLDSNTNGNTYFIEGRSFPVWRFFLDLDASETLMPLHVPFVCLGRSPRRPWNEPCKCCSANSHAIPDKLMAKDVNPSEIERQRHLSWRLEQLMEHCNAYRRTRTTSLLAQASGIVRVLQLDSLVYVTATQPRLERCGETKMIRHGLHIHFHSVFVDQHRAARLRHACIDRLARDDDMSTLLQIDTSRLLAGYFSSLLDPCAVTDPASGTGVRFLYQFKARWTPSHADACKCPKTINDSSQYCVACQANWAVVVQNYAPRQVIDQYGQLLAKETEYFTDARNILFAMEKCSVHAPSEEQRHLGRSLPSHRTSPTRHPPILHALQRIIQQAFIGLLVDLDSVWLGNFGSDFPTIYAQGKSHQCLNVDDHPGDRVVEHMDRERPFWTIESRQLFSNPSTVTVEYRCRSRYKNPMTGIRCMDLNSCNALRFACATDADQGLVSVLKQFCSTTGEGHVDRDMSVPPSKRLKTKE